VCGIRITHPDKVFWPATKRTDAVTKLDLAQYLEKVAERMLEHVSERPISVVRAPDGLEGERFFQRHKLMGTAVPMLALRVRGEAQPYLGIKGTEGLVALAQAGVVEIHPWGSKPGDPDVPERIILDLDPGEGVSFDKVIDAARELRERLQDLGFVPFVKTTGGKGIHVVIAIKGRAKNTPTWSDAKAFARAIAFRTPTRSRCPRSCASERSSSTICGMIAPRRAWRLGRPVFGPAPQSPSRSNGLK
jgi:bifunctional non-homologous end joining protein LigD